MTTISATPDTATASVQLSIPYTSPVTRVLRNDENGIAEVRTLSGQLPTGTSGTLLLSDYEAAQGLNTYTAYVTDVATRTNLATNPSFETASGTVNVRTNLIRNPNLEFDFNWYSTANEATGARVASTALSGSYVGRITFTGTTVEDSGLVLGSAAAWAYSTTYTISMDLLSPETRLVKFSAQGDGTVNQNSAGISLTANVRKRVSWTFQTAASGVVALYLLRNDLVGGTLDFDSVLAEASSTAGTYFDGATPITNLVTNPSFETNTTGWNSGSSAVLTRDTSKSYNGTASLKVDTSASGAFSGAIFYPSITVGRAYSFSAWVWIPTGTSMNLAFDGAGAQMQPQTITGTSAWQKVTASTTSADASFPLLFRSTAANQPAFWVDQVMLENSATVGPYYEGQGDFTYAWSGTANASTSYQQAPGVTDVTMLQGYAAAYQSKQSFSSGTKALRITPQASHTDTFAGLWGGGNPYAWKANTTYTIAGDRTIAAPQTGAAGAAFRVNIGTELNVTLKSPITNTTGTQRVVGTFTTGTGTNLNFLRLYNGAPAGGGDVWWDNVIVEEGDTGGTYFDGATPDATDVDYAWTGTANASTSTQTTTTRQVAATTTLVLDAPWLMVPIMPNYALQAETITGYDSSRESRSTVHAVIGRADPLVSFGPLGTRTGSLEIWCESLKAARDLETVFTRGETVMLKQNVPGMDMYFVGSSTGITPFTAQGDTTRYALSISYTEIKRPLGFLAGALGWDFNALAAAYASFDVVTATFATFDDLTIRNEQ